MERQRMPSSVKPPVCLVDEEDNEDRVTMWREAFGTFTITEDRDPARKPPITIQIDDPRTLLAIGRAIFRELGVAA